MKIPYALEYTVNLLQNSSLVFESINKDKRNDSSLAEDKIIEYLENHSDNIQYISAPIREWYDVKIIDKINNLEYYVNIKSPGTINSKGDCASSAIESVGYVLTGISPENVKYSKDWKKYFKWLSENINPNNKEDYWYLVVPKEDIKKTFVNSMRGLSVLQPNGNGLPFQIAWSKNTEYNPTNTSQDFYKIFNALYQSWEKRANPFLTLQENYEQILGKFSYDKV